MCLSDAKDTAASCAPGTGKPKKAQGPEESDTQYRALVARANFLSADRPDISYVVKELCPAMSVSTLLDWSVLKRLGQYLLGKPHMI